MGDDGEEEEEEAGAEEDVGLGDEPMALEEGQHAGMTQA